jgi:hypothetical protein
MSLQATLGWSSGARPRNGSRTYLFTGMIQCASGHGPKAMYGKVDKGTTYHVSAYARDYGDPHDCRKPIASTMPRSRSPSLVKTSTEQGKSASKRIHSPSSSFISSPGS